MAKEQLDDIAEGVISGLEKAGLQTVSLPQEVHGVFGESGFQYEQYTIVIQSIGGVNTRKIDENSLPLMGAMQTLRDQGHDLIKVTLVEGFGGISDVFIISKLMKMAYINVTHGSMKNLGGIFGNNAYGFDAQQDVNGAQGLLTVIKNAIPAQKTKNKEA